ncbi:hypothetical protein [Paenibacillus sp. BJ-4]|uniref:hypothetical protein n=1 Tax=Paenibacillus sp. BJ-4 TaxID=2878097 RepID=UPI001CF0D479|nr:hypothetical protein [Paenibacillus sp. BJ-4]
MSLDAIIDDYLKPKKRKVKLISRILPYILLVIITFGMIFLLFIYTPKDAWITYKTYPNNITLKDVMFGLYLKATTDRLYITQGEMTNVTSLSVEINGEIQTLAPNERTQASPARPPTTAQPLQQVLLLQGVIYPDDKFSTAPDVAIPTA